MMCILPPNTIITWQPLFPQKQILDNDEPSII